MAGEWWDLGSDYTQKYRSLDWSSDTYEVDTDVHEQTMLSDKSAIRSQVANVCCELRMELPNKVSAGNPGSPHCDREQPELRFQWALEA